MLNAVKKPKQDNGRSIGCNRLPSSNDCEGYSEGVGDITEEAACEMIAECQEASEGKIRRVSGSGKTGEQVQRSWVHAKFGAFKDRQAASVVGSQ